MQSFLLSVLAQQYGGTAAADFAATFPDPWLMWESGNWAPAQVNTLSLDRQGLDLSSPPSKSEALLFQLRLPRGKTELAIGRAPPCEVVINDGTLSKRHATLLRGDRGWSLRDDGSRNGTWVSEVITAPGRLMPLAPGTRIRLGTARLSFLNSTGLHAKLVKG